jgi:hypothetical protein
MKGAWILYFFTSEEFFSSTTRNAEEPSQYPTLPPDPLASARSFAFTVSMANVCTPGWAYLETKSLFSSFSFSETEYNELSPGAGARSARRALFFFFAAAREPGPAREYAREQDARAWKPVQDF